MMSDILVRGVALASKPRITASISCGSNAAPSAVSILSTPRGVLSGEEAKKQNVGGELLLVVW